jgi:hypothetical protein
MWAEHHHVEWQHNHVLVDLLMTEEVPTSWQAWLRPSLGRGRSNATIMRKLVAICSVFDQP